MKIKFSVRNIYNNKFVVAYSVPRLGGTTLDLVGNFTFQGFSLADCVSRARKVIYSRLYIMRSNGVPVPPAHNIQLEWDMDVTDLPEAMQKQKQFQTSLFSAPSDLRASEPKPAAAPAEPALFELVKKKDVWTLFKHERPLMTWEQACELLKQKVENNE